jgi:hypothetical protein
MLDLDAIGFNWEAGASFTRGFTPNDGTFFAQIDELKAYKDKHGHLNMSHKEDRRLYDFCGSLRRSQKAIINGKGKIQYSLDDGRIAALDAMDLNGNQPGHYLPRPLRMTCTTAAMDSTGSWKLWHPLPWSLRMTGRKRRWAQKETVSLLDWTK